MFAAFAVVLSKVTMAMLQPLHHKATHYKYGIMYLYKNLLADIPPMLSKILE